MPRNEIDGLIIRHLADIEAACKRIANQIEPQVNSAIDDVVKEWTDDNAWSSDGDFANNNLWLAPSDWQLNLEEGEWASRFWLYAGESGWEDEYRLSQICGVGQGTVGIWWAYEKVDKRWKNFAADFVVTLRRLGFHYEETAGSFFLPFQIDPAMLAKSVEDDAIDKAMQPLRAALAGLEPDARVEFDRMLAAARQDPRLIGVR